MQVQALDHVNVITGDLEGTCAFYHELLGLERRDGPPPPRSRKSIRLRRGLVRSLTM